MTGKVPRARMKQRRLAPLALLMAAPFLMAQTEPETDAMRRILAAHNAARAEVGTPPLAWSTDLAVRAQFWAERIAGLGELLHEVGADGGSGQGENLWAGTRRAFTPEEMIAGWVNEKSHFVPGRFPEVSLTGDWKFVGHYTQIVWRTTSEVGCGIADNGREEYLVCRYRTPGNVIGEYPY